MAIVPFTVHPVVLVADCAHTVPEVTSDALQAQPCGAVGSTIGCVDTPRVPVHLKLPACTPPVNVDVVAHAPVPVPSVNVAPPDTTALAYVIVGLFVVSPIVIAVGLKLSSVYAVCWLVLLLPVDAGTCSEIVDGVPVPVPKPD